MDFETKKKQYKTKMRGVCIRYSHLLNDAELTACEDMALWHCIQDYDPNRGKFSTLLLNYVRWECCRLIKDNTSREDSIETIGLCPCDTKPLQQTYITDLLDELSDIERKVIIARYYGNMQQKEIATKFGYSRQGIAAIIRRSLDKMGSGV